MTKLVETPLEDHYRSLYTSLAETLLQCSFHLRQTLLLHIEKKQYKDFPPTTNATEEINNTLPKILPPSATTVDTSKTPHSNIVQPPSFLMFSKLLILIIALFLSPALVIND